MAACLSGETPAAAASRNQSEPGRSKRAADAVAGEPTPPPATQSIAGRPLSGQIVDVSSYEVERPLWPSRAKASTPPVSSRKAIAQAAAVQRIEQQTQHESSAGDGDGGAARRLSVGGGDVEEADSVVSSGGASSDVGTTVYLARGMSVPW